MHGRSLDKLHISVIISPSGIFVKLTSKSYVETTQKNRLVKTILFQEVSHSVLLTNKKDIVGKEVDTSLSSPLAWFQHGYLKED